MKSFLKFLFAFTSITLILVLSGISTKAASASMLDIGQESSLGSQVKVPVTIRNTTYLTSATIETEVPSNAKGITLREFEVNDLFNGEQFRTVTNIDGNRLTIDILSLTGKEQRLKNKSDVIGYITYDLSDDFSLGTSTPLEITELVATGRNERDISLDPLNGEILRKMPIGDVVGDNRISATGAIRILQHINGDPIIDREAFLSADVDGDGILTQMDALQILDYATGNRTTFLAVAAQQLPTGVLKSEYYAKIDALHGRKPYTFKRKSGTLPSGLKLNPDTGELTGTLSRAKDFQFTIQVTDAVGNTADRQFSMTVMDSNIISTDPLETINVKRGESPKLPSEVTVTYKDKTKGKEKVTWEAVDTSTLGETLARGTIGEIGFTIFAKVNVVYDNYLDSIDEGYFDLLNIHTLTLTVKPDVYAVTINNQNALYEGNNQFSLVSPTFPSGSNVTIRLFDKYGNILETKVYTLTS